MLIGTLCAYKHKLCRHAFCMVVSVGIRRGYGNIEFFSVYIGAFFSILEWPNVETNGGKAMDQKTFFYIRVADRMIRDAQNMSVEKWFDRLIPLALAGEALEYAADLVRRDPEYATSQGRKYAVLGGESSLHELGREIAAEYRTMAEELSGEMPESSREWADCSAHWEAWASQWRPCYSPGMAGAEYHPDPDPI